MRDKISGSPSLFNLSAGAFHDNNADSFKTIARFTFQDAITAPWYLVTNNIVCHLNA